MDGDDFGRQQEHEEEEEELEKVSSSSTSVDEEVDRHNNNNNITSGDEEVDRRHNNNIPLGYRFSPTDSQAFAYLIHKVYSVNSLNVYLGTILEFNIYRCQPSDLPELSKGEDYCYYFTQRDRRFSTGTRINRVTKDGNGYWRITSKITEFKEGKRNTLVYYLKTKLEKGKGRKTNWIMHEYVLNETPPPNSQAFARGNKVNDVVLCRIYERKQEHEEEKGIFQKSSGCIPTKDRKELTPGTKRKLCETRLEFDESSHDNLLNNHTQEDDENDIDLRLQLGTPTHQKNAKKK